MLSQFLYMKHVPILLEYKEDAHGILHSVGFWGIWDSSLQKNVKYSFALLVLFPAIFPWGVSYVAGYAQQLSLAVNFSQFHHFVEASQWSKVDG